MKESDSVVAAMPAPAPAFLQREAVFDRKNRPSGHIFFLQEESPLATAPTLLQRMLDEKLLATLLSSPDAWNTQRAFIPLSSASLWHATIERLPVNNLILMIQLAEEQVDAEQLLERLKDLRNKGLSIGIVRQPHHPCFGPAIQQADFAIIDAATTEAGSVRDFSAAVRASEKKTPLALIALGIETLDEHNLCRTWHFEGFHGAFAAKGAPRPEQTQADPHKVQLLNLMRLVQSDAENNEIAAGLKQDPLLTFRILRYLNSPALGLSHRIESINQAITILGRQRLTRWLAVLLFSVREPDFSDWLLVESALTRGRLMEVLGAEVMPHEAHDALFLTGIFSCLDRLLRRPMAEALAMLSISDHVENALLNGSGPYASLLALAKASETFDLERISIAAESANLEPDKVNRALLAATAWASEVTDHWE
ncbi:MAG: HDOD domain-containing protein [Rhodocyclaceae bacterium]|nr:HDOD domain-containing protein [Rhodocyclaceae bacterium]